MKKVTIKDKAVSLGLDKNFKNVKTIEIEDRPFNEGGFGRIYKCLSVNGKKCKIPQVIKIFKDTGGSAAHSYRTISSLLHGLIGKKAELDALGVDFIEYYPALLGAPQFVFEGTMDGQFVQGYSANNLNHFGYVCFSDILDDDETGEKYSEISLDSRYGKSYQLVRVFELLNELRYIHADFKADNFFVSLKDDDKCALIDFDSGVIVRGINDEPFTAGTPSQDMLAPEIRSQLRDTGHATVNMYSDIWSVAVACHYLLLLSHPFDILSEVSDRAIKSYNDSFMWPHIEESFDYVNEDLVEYLEDLEDNYDILDDGILSCFRATFTKGYFQPTYRSSYSQWRLKLTPLIPQESQRWSIPQIRRKKGLDSSQTEIPKNHFKQEDFMPYMSSLVEKLIKHEAFLPEVRDTLKQIEEDLGKTNLEKKLVDFLTTYYDIWADGVITDIERGKFTFAGRSLGIDKKVIDNLLNKK